MSQPDDIRNERIPLALLDPDPANPRRHPPEQIARIRASLREFGQPRSIVIQAAEGGRYWIVAGHGVTQAAGAEDWPEIRADVIPAEWPRWKVRGYLLADNRLGQFAEDDDAMIANILSEIRQYSPETMEAAGYTPDEADDLARRALAEMGIGDDRDQIGDFPTSDLKAPYPYFGGKRAIAGAVWARFGQVDNYVEPFFGSGAVLLARPHLGGVETINDLDGMIANFWRAVQADPDAVAGWVDWPVNESDLFARHLWLVQQRARLTERLHADPAHYDAQIAGWWCWGICNWIGSGWCSGTGAWTVSEDGETVGNAGQGVNRQIPHLGDAGRGVNRGLPHLGDAGRGVNRQIPHLGGGWSAGQGALRHGDNAPTADTPGQCAAWAEHLARMMGALSDRLRRARVASGDWSRVVTPSVTYRHGLTGVFLDPPYGQGSLEYASGGNADADLIRDVQQWAIANGDNELLRIALCGYDPLPLPMPGGWRGLRWTAPKGYQGEDNEDNRREIIWFSPHCEEIDP